MRIIIDIGHPAHIHYFKNFIKIMEKKGHIFFVLARDKEVSFALLNKYDIVYYNRGKGAKNILGKLLYLLKADYLLFKKAIRFKPDLFLSFASPYAAHVSGLLGKPHVSCTDTDNAKLGILSFVPFTKHILTPVSFKKSFGTKHIRFKGFMELCYLHKSYFKPDHSILNVLNIKPNENFIIFRLISWDATHDIGQGGIDYQSTLTMVNELNKKAKVFISSEKELPAELIHYQIKIQPERMHDALAYATLFIGEGATMTSECAMLGTPAIYVNSLSAGTLEEQEKYGLIYGFRNSKGVLEKAFELLNLPNLKKEFKKRRDAMLTEKIDVTAFMIWFIENYPESVRIMKENPDYQRKFK